MRKLSTLLIATALFAHVQVNAKDYTVHSAAELSQLSLQAGDKVILAQGDWKDQQLVFKGKGKENKPIILTADQPGKLQLTGNSHLLIDGEYLEVNGITFTDGYSLKGDVVVFSDASSHCRFTNSAIINYNHPDKKVDYKWLSLHGNNNRVDHCFMQGKTHQGTTLVVWLSNKANYHRIDHNYFGERPDLGVNGGETIRIGTSDWSMHDSYTTVEENIFYHCNGEMEVVSNKSCNNTIANNLFYECVGTLTLRHGNSVSVYGNYFIGNGVKETGGIRIIGENHRVYNNYLQGLTGKGLKAAISMMNAMTNPPLNGYWQVKNPIVVNNTIVDCKQGFDIGAGKNDTRTVVPVNGVIMNNLVQHTPAIQLTDQPEKFTISNNIISNDAAADGFTEQKNVLKKQDGLYVPDNSVVNTAKGDYSFTNNKNMGAPVTNPTQQKLLKGEGVGPAWMSFGKELKL